MKVTKTKLEGCVIIEPEVFKDDRGYFFESFKSNNFNKAIGQKIIFVQDNQSFSVMGTLRGLHYQKGKYAQAKLVRVISGRVLDVAVDLRQDSPTFGQHVSLELSAKNKKQLFIPRGFGHGFIVLSDSADFFYKCDNFYNSAAEGGIIFNDPILNIDWKVQADQIKVSGKDLALPQLNDVIF